MIELRKFSLLDAPRLAELLNCEDISRWTSNIPFPYTVQDAHQWLSGEIGLPDRIPFAVEHNNELVACVSFWPYSESAYEVGYWVAKTHWGNGIASTALSMLIADDLFPKCDKIVAKIMQGNTASERVLIKTGFVYVGDCEIKKRGKLINGLFFERPATLL